MANVSFHAPTDYAAEQAAIDRQRQMALLLQQKGQEPLGPTESIGGWAVPRSMWEGVGKASQQISGAYQQNELDERQKTLAAKLRMETSNDFRDAMALGDGTPAREAQAREGPLYGDEGAEAGPMPGVAARAEVKPDKAGMYAKLLNSNSPMLQQLGMTQYAEDRKLHTLAKDARLVKGDGTVIAGAGPKEPEFYGNSSVVLDGKVYTMQLDKNGGPPKFTQATQQNAYNSGTVDASRNLTWKQYEFQNLPAEARAKLRMEAQRLGISAMELFDKTGTTVGTGVNLPPNQPMPNFSGPQNNFGQQPPQGPAPVAQPQAPAPQIQPRPMPQAQPQVLQPRPGSGPAQPLPGQVAPAAAVAPAPAPLAPADRRKLALENATQRQTADVGRELEMRGLGDTIDEARKALKTMPTGSSVGQIADYVGGAVGLTVDGARQAASLKTIAASLTAKMPRMQGPQSDADRKMYETAAGDVGNASVPVPIRMEALATVERLFRKYDKTSPVAPGIDMGGAAASMPDRRRPNPKVQNYDANGNRI